MDNPAHAVAGADGWDGDDGVGFGDRSGHVGTRRRLGLGARGPYFGVPLQNFAGWLLTTVTVYFCYGLWARRSLLHDAPVVPQWFGSLPPVVYGIITFRYIIENEQGVLGVVALFAMGLPCLIAIWWHFDRDHSRSRTSRVALSA